MIRFTLNGIFEEDIKEKKLKALKSKVFFGKYLFPGEKLNKLNFIPDIIFSFWLNCFILLSLKQYFKIKNFYYLRCILYMEWILIFLIKFFFYLLSLFVPTIFWVNPFVIIWNSNILIYCTKQNMRRMEKLCMCFKETI